MKQLQEMLKLYFAEGQTDYDITAVLKYIGKYRNIEFNCDHNVFEVRDISDGELIFEVENKPLHLYTEKEDKDLLELIKKIGQTNK